MSKLEEIMCHLRRHGDDLSNAALALACGCDEGLVRRAKARLRIEQLEEERDAARSEAEALRAELVTLREGLAGQVIERRRPGRPRQAKNEFRPLWEKLDDSNQPVPTLAMIGD